MDYNDSNQIERLKSVARTKQGKEIVEYLEELKKEKDEQLKDVDVFNTDSEVSSRYRYIRSQYDLLDELINILTADLGETNN